MQEGGVVSQHRGVGGLSGGESQEHVFSLLVSPLLQQNVSEEAACVPRLLILGYEVRLEEGHGRVDTPLLPERAREESEGVGKTSDENLGWKNKDMKFSNEEERRK